LAPIARSATDVACFREIEPRFAAVACGGDARIKANDTTAQADNRKRRQAPSKSRAPSKPDAAKNT
jgi:hypothetical protein